MRLDAFGAIVEAEEATEHTHVPVERFAAVFARIRCADAATVKRSSPDSTNSARQAKAVVETAIVADTLAGAGARYSSAVQSAPSDPPPSTASVSGQRQRRAKKKAGVLFDAEPFIAADCLALTSTNAWWRELLTWSSALPPSAAIPNPSERAQLLLSIDSVRHPSHRAWLTELTRCAFDDDPSAEVRAAALRALAVLGFGEEDGHRFRRAGDGSAGERQAAVETLAGHEFRVSWARGVLESLAS